MKVSFAVEKLTPELAIEANATIEKHANEVYARWRAPVRMEASPQVREYLVYEDAGILRACVARDETGRMVGYAVIILDRHPHVGLLFGRIDMMYLDAEVRKTVYSAAFLEYAEEQIREAGASFAYFGVPFKLALALEQRGWFPEEVGVVKYFEQE